MMTLTMPEAYQVGPASTDRPTVKTGLDVSLSAFARPVLHADWDALGSSVVHSRTRHAGTDAVATSFCSCDACCRQW